MSAPVGMSQSKNILKGRLCHQKVAYHKVSSSEVLWTNFLHKSLCWAPFYASNWHSLAILLSLLSVVPAFYLSAVAQKLPGTFVLTSTFTCHFHHRVKTVVLRTVLFIWMFLNYYFCISLFWWKPIFLQSPTS